MEISIQKHGGSDIPKKSRSVDLKGIHAEKSRDSAGKSLSQNGNLEVGHESKGLKRGNTFPFENRGSVPVESRRKRNRKEVSLNGFGPLTKRKRNGLNSSRLKPNGFVSGVGKPENKTDRTEGSHGRSNLSGSSQNLGKDLDLAPLKKGEQSSSEVGHSHNFNGLGDSIVIPKGLRGISRHRKPGSSVNSKIVKNDSALSGNSNADAQLDKLSLSAILPSQALTGKKKKKKLNEVKDNGFGRHKSARRIEEISRNAQSRKKKGSRVVASKAHAFDGIEKFHEDLQEDDEENLEQNAARMLSSRFDPSCTRFLGNTKPVNRFSVTFKSSQAESSLVDGAGRMLRPRKRNGKSFVRKRRHFYEVSSRDIDPYCLVKQRIRVFWPLDKSWYFGLVKDYDPVTGLHYVKYDDRDEEWIDLQNERFKLLLFPSEINGRFNYGESQSELKQNDKKEVEETVDDICLESEPIITWLTRSKHQGKSSSTNISKKQRRVHLFEGFEPSTSFEPRGHASVNSSLLLSKSEEALPEVPVPEGTSSIDRKLSFVYFRKRFHKRRECLHKTMKEESVHESLATSIGILASVADSTSVLEELNMLGTCLELKQVRVKLSLQPLCIYDVEFGTKIFLMSYAFYLLQFGKLMPLWPMVHMEIVLVDNVQGPLLLLFEGSLRQAVEILCLIITTFNQHNEQRKHIEIRMPFTSIGFKLSGLHDQGGQLLFVVYSFLELENSKWGYLEDKLKQQCIMMGKLPLADCKCFNFKNLSSKSDQMLCTSVYENAASLKVFPERSCADTIHQLTPHKSVDLNTFPAPCYMIDKHEGYPPCSLSRAVATSTLLSLHLKLLIENSAASVSFSKPVVSLNYSDDHDKLTTSCHSPVEDHSDQISDITIEKMGSSLSQVAATSSCMNIESNALSLRNGGNRMRSSDDFLSCEANVIGKTLGLGDPVMNVSDETVDRCQKFACHAESGQVGEMSCSSFLEGSSSPDESEGGCNSIDVQGQLGQVEEQSIDKGTQTDQSASELLWEVNVDAIHFPTPTAPRSIWRHSRHSSVLHTFDHFPKLWAEDGMLNGFVRGSKKPRTRVSYSLPVGSFEAGSKTQRHQRKAHLYKKIKSDDAKISACSESSQRYHKSLSCDANVLVTVGDRGWRECGAQIVLDSDDQKDWRICIKFAGATKYVYKARHVLQPGITNRYTHAMMWKGGKDWALEFTDRRQWSLFKQMHEECYNSTIRAAYVKNIPIPGVSLIADDDDNTGEVPFVRGSSEYYRQVGTEVDIALDPSHVLYDMDSGDEEWISEIRKSFDSEGNKMSELTDEIFERAIDMLEKFAYDQQCDEFSDEEIEEFMAAFGPVDIVKPIYQHWREKRLKKGLPLIRQFQPPLWERYQQQLKDWELAMGKMHNSPAGCQYKACSVKKPPMFAFCLRPRGLELPNKGSKQRSHKKLMSSGNHNGFARWQDGFPSFGRRHNGYSIGEENVSAVLPSYESSDSYHSNDGSERCHYPKFYRNNSKKRGMFPSPRDPPMMSFTCNKKLKKTHSAGVYEWPNMRQVQYDGLRRFGSDIDDEVKLRDASSAAKHASNMAKMMRNKAECLLHKADLALHKAAAALMIAEARKESEQYLATMTDI